MHEMALGQAILDLALDTAKGSGLARVTRIELEIGKDSAVEVEALTFCLPLIAADTAADGAAITVSTPPLKLRCKACATEHCPAHAHHPCPNCGSFGGEVLSGREMRVVAIEGE
jgi:hydrogenase nickel incorporation protein HypA/HybF